MSKEVRGRNRPCTPILPTYPNMVTAPWEKHENSYKLTPEQLEEVIQKYGAPTMKLSERKGHHYMEGKKK